MNVGKSKKEEQKQLGTSSPWVLIYGKKAVRCHVRKRSCPLGGWVTVPRVTWLHSVFFYGMSEWGGGGWGGGSGFGDGGEARVDGAFPEESLLSVSVCDIWRSTQSAHKPLNGHFPTVPCEFYALPWMRYSMEGNATTSCKSSINNVLSIGIGKAGGLFLY